MSNLMKRAISSMESVDASASAHLAMRIPRLVSAIRELIEHSCKFGQSEELDVLLKERPGQGEAPEYMVDVLNDFINRAGEIERQLALGKPSTALLPADERISQDLFDIFQKPYLAAMDYIEFFAVDIGALVEFLQPEDGY